MRVYKSSSLFFIIMFMSFLSIGRVQALTYGEKIHCTFTINQGAWDQTNLKFNAAIGQLTEGAAVTVMTSLGEVTPKDFEIKADGQDKTYHSQFDIVGEPFQSKAQAGSRYVSLTSLKICGWELTKTGVDIWTISGVYQGHPFRPVNATCDVSELPSSYSSFKGYPEIQYSMSLISNANVRYNKGGTCALQ